MDLGLPKWRGVHARVHWVRENSMGRYSEPDAGSSLTPIVGAALPVILDRGLPLVLGTGVFRGAEHIVLPSP